MDEDISLISRNNNNIEVDDEHTLEDNIELQSVRPSKKRKLQYLRYAVWCIIFIVLNVLCMTLLTNDYLSIIKTTNTNTPSTEVLRRHIGLTVAVANDSRRLAQLSTMVYSSWRFVNTFKEAEFTIIDLLISCQPPCLYLPAECRPMTEIEHTNPIQYETEKYTTRDGSELFEHDHLPNCWYFPQPPLPEVWERLNYQFMRSVYFLLPYPFNYILPRYDYILRSDEDTFITPYILDYVPPHKMSFGVGHYTIQFTRDHLREVATKYGYTYRNVSDICSTWFLPPLMVSKLVTLSMDVGQKLLENEFNVNAAGVGQFFVNNENGDWPKWWRGVVSMYAAEIAINHLITDLNEGYKTDAMDHPTSDTTSSIKKLVLLHCYQDDNPFAKFHWYDYEISAYNLLDEEGRRKYLRQYLTTEDMHKVYGVNRKAVEKMSPSRYAAFNVWKMTSLISVFPK